MLLRTRVDRLERRSLPQSGVPDLWVHARVFDAELRGRGITEVWSGGRVWHRQPGEAEKEFKARVALVAPGPYPRLFVCTVGGAPRYDAVDTP